MLTPKRPRPPSRLSMPAPRSAPAQPPKVLLTGFEPFGGEIINPSWQAVSRLHGRQVARHRLVAAQLPTVFGQSLTVLKQLLALHRPALVLCVGQAGGRGAISLERIAINVDDARMADNAAQQPIDRPVVAQGPAAYFSTLPIKAMLHGLQGKGFAAEVSQTAGTFVCNHVFYGLMDTLATQTGFQNPDGGTVRGGFVHVPYLPEQGSPSMVLDDMVQGLLLAVGIALRQTPGQDMHLGAGAIL